MPGWNRPFYCSRSQWNHSDKASLLEGGGFVRRTKTEGVERATLPYQPKPLYEKEKELLLPQSPSVTAPSSEGAFASYRPFYRLRWWWNSSGKTKAPEFLQVLCLWWKLQGSNLWPCCRLVDIETSCTIKENHPGFPEWFLTMVEVTGLEPVTLCL